MRLLMHAERRPVPCRSRRGAYVLLAARTCSISHWTYLLLAVASHACTLPASLPKLFSKGSGSIMERLKTKILKFQARCSARGGRQAASSSGRLCVKEPQRPGAVFAAEKAVRRRRVDHSLAHTVRRSSDSAKQSRRRRGRRKEVVSLKPKQEMQRFETKGRLPNQSSGRW